ncbi:MAG: DUF302 domain-containing protein [Deltaproteobacteria bacterium]|nr:DUF302 domain-containing protein [Deltaproteobacteria bacterium]
MTEVSYGYTKNLGVIPFDQALDNVAEALKTEGFGVLTEIDIKATLKKKLDVDFRRYRILGACNPALAHRALSRELLVGLLLPCNVVVFEEDDGSVSVSMVKPKEMFKVTGNQELTRVVGEVDAKLIRVLEAIE